MEALGIDAKLLVAQIVNFAIFYVIFKKFIAKPLLAHLHKQEQDEVMRQKMTHDLQSAHAAMEEEKNKMVKSIREQEKIMLAEARKQAEGLKSDIVAEGQKQAQIIVQAGKESALAEREAIQTELKTYITQTVKTALSKGLTDYLTPDMQKDITKHIITSLK